MDINNQDSKEMQLLARKIEFLDKPERREFFPPEELLKQLPIRNTDNILDLGAGTGFLTIPAAKMTNGVAHALDIDANMLEVIKSKANKENINNIQLMEGSIDNIPLSDDSVDIAIASLILHEVSSLPKTLQEIRRVLKDGGYFVCLEYDKIESTIGGPPMHIRIASSTMEEELKNAGFNVIEKVLKKEPLYIFIVKK